MKVTHLSIEQLYLSVKGELDNLGVTIQEFINSEIDDWDDHYSWWTLRDLHLFCVDKIRDYMGTLDPTHCDVCAKAYDQKSGS